MGASGKVSVRGSLEPISQTRTLYSGRGYGAPPPDLIWTGWTAGLDVSHRIESNRIDSD